MTNKKRSSTEGKKNVHEKKQKTFRLNNPLGREYELGMGRHSNPVGRGLAPPNLHRALQRSGLAAGWGINTIGDV